LSPCRRPRALAIAAAPPTLSSLRRDTEAVGRDSINGSSLPHHRSCQEDGATRGEHSELGLPSRVGPNPVLRGWGLIHADVTGYKPIGSRSHGPCLAALAQLTAHVGRCPRGPMCPR